MNNDQEKAFRRPVQEYRLDLGDIADREALQDRLQECLPLPAYYGRNLDALHDVLTSVSAPCRIVVCGMENVGRDAGEDFRRAYAGLMHVLQDAANANANLAVFWEYMHDTEGDLNF